MKLEFVVSHKPEPSADLQGGRISIVARFDESLKVEKVETWRTHVAAIYGVPRNAVVTQEEYEQMCSDEDAQMERELIRARSESLQGASTEDDRLAAIRRKLQDVIDVCQRRLVDPVTVNVERYRALEAQAKIVLSCCDAVDQEKKR